MLRLGRDFRGFFLYEDSGALNAIGGAILVPTFMILAPPALVLLFFWCLGIRGAVLSGVMALLTFLAFFLSKKSAGVKKLAVSAWYGAIISALFAFSTVYSVHAKGDWGFLIWLAMGICGMALLILGITIGGSIAATTVYFFSLILSWLFSMTINYGLVHNRALPDFIYLTILISILLQLIVALFHTLRLLLGGLR